ncbi:MAG: hypothetical protein M3Z08_18065 [Chloroflexota bacterium]|nr:hypothetical protein [Chloroflexota bacterium]
MLDNMFPFIDPFVEPIEESLFDFIAQAEAFFDEMEKRGEPVKLSRPISEETYKQMWMLRYQQHLGTLSFLELLDKYEEILGISGASHSG